MESKPQESKESEFVNVDYEMKTQLKLFVGERSKTPFDSGCKIFDLALNEPFEVSNSIILKTRKTNLEIVLEEIYHIDQ